MVAWSAGAIADYNLSKRTPRCALYKNRNQVVYNDRRRWELFPQVETRSVHGISIFEDPIRRLRIAAWVGVGFYSGTLQGWLAPATWYELKPRLH